MIRIRKGFQGQRLALYPSYVESGMERPALQLHSIGAFPDAEFHYVERPFGCGEYVLIWCTAGEGWFSLKDGIKHPVTKSQFFVLPADTPHAYGSSEAAPWSIYWLHFRGSGASAVYERLHGLHTLEANVQVSRLSALFDEILIILEGHADADTVTYVDMLFPHLLSAFLYPNIWSGVHTANVGAANVSIVSKATHYMNEHLAEKLSLSDICTYLGYSESYFTRIFTKEVGYSPIAYLMHLKVERAQHLLINTPLKINQIAFMLGFDDPYYFSKFFSKITGSSPRLFRKIHRG
ncbi:MAG: AraC family transcriptional regulator [Alistipes sp.]|nr:AraC family transcriptional regulator [Alistipes sp.]